MSDNPQGQQEINHTPEHPFTYIPAPPPEQWRPRDLIIFLLYIPFALIVSNLVAFAGYAIIGPLVGWHTPIREMQTNTIFLLSLQLIFYAFVLAYIYFLIAIHYQAHFWGTLKWLRLSGRQTIRFLLGGAVLSFLVMFAPPVLPERKSFPLEKLFSPPSSAYAVAGFAVLVAPFVEELLFRGLLFAFFEKHGGLKFAVITTAVLFAGLHIPEYWGAWDHALMILVVGLVFSIARGRTGSVTPSFILHLSYNATTMFAAYVQTQHFQKIPGVLGF